MARHAVLGHFRIIRCDLILSSYDSSDFEYSTSALNLLCTMSNQPSESQTPDGSVTTPSVEVTSGAMPPQQRTTSDSSSLTPAIGSLDVETDVDHHLVGRAAELFRHTGAPTPAPELISLFGSQSREATQSQEMQPQATQSQAAQSQETQSQASQSQETQSQEIFSQGSALEGATHVLVPVNNPYSSELLRHEGVLPIWATLQVAESPPIGVLSGVTLEGAAVESVPTVYSIPGPMETSPSKTGDVTPTSRDALQAGSLSECVE